MEWMEGRKEKKWPASTVPEKEVATFFLQRAASAQLTIIGGNNNQKTQEEAFSSSQQVETGIPFGIYIFFPRFLLSVSLFCPLFLSGLFITVIIIIIVIVAVVVAAVAAVVIIGLSLDDFRPIRSFISLLLRLRGEWERIPSGFQAVSERFRSGLQLTWPLMCLKRWEETQRHSKMRRKHPADSRAISEQFPSRLGTLPGKLPPDLISFDQRSVWIGGHQSGSFSFLFLLEIFIYSFIELISLLDYFILFHSSWIVFFFFPFLFSFFLVRFLHLFVCFWLKIVSRIQFQYNEPFQLNSECN